MKIKLLYFASVRERVGHDAEEVTLPDRDIIGVEDLWAELITRHPTLGPLRQHLRLGVNLDFATPQTLVHDGDEVAIIPPVAGGCEAPQRISPVPLSLDAVIARVSRPEAGAVATFTGVVRNHSQGRDVTTLEYEIYPEMAIAKLDEIERSVERDYPDTRCAICHRHGQLTVGDLAVVIAVSAPHRASALDACAQAIERVKLSVPIWKKETGPDGTCWVGMGS